MQRKLWEIITDNQADKPDVAIRSIAELHKLSNSLCQMYEMLPVLGRLPSDSFAGFVVGGGDGDGNVDDADKEDKEVLSSSSQSSYIGGNSAGIVQVKT